MTDLDTLAAAATRELVERSAPDVPARSGELRRIRSRRAAAKLVAAAAAVALGAGGWQLSGAPHHRPQPAPEPGGVVNGALVAAAGGLWSTISGRPLPNLPDNSRAYSTFQFTGDGSSVVFPDLRDQVSIANLSTGEERTLAECIASCDVSLSPDGRVLAFGAGPDVELLTLSTGEVVSLPVEGAKDIGRPVWSPDGTELSFATKAGLFVMSADGGDARLLYPSSDPVSGPITPSWSPDGSSLAFLDPTKLAGSGGVHDSRFTVVVVDHTSGAATTVHDAGHCYCLGLTPPAVAWSPDGELIAVATTHGVHDPGGARAPGVYVVHPDGTGWTRLAVGDFRAVAWQPLAE